MRLGHDYAGRREESEMMKETKLSPWLLGVIDTLVGAAVIRNSAIPSRNRLAVMLIDSAFETACRAFLQYKARVKLVENHKHRDNLVSIVRSKLPDIDDDVWDSINFYYTEIRCDFYHQSAGKTITDVAILDYLETVEFVINKAFGIEVAQMVTAAVARVAQDGNPTHERDPASLPPLPQVKGGVNKMLLAVAQLSPKAVDQVNEFFRQQGEPTRMTREQFIGLVGRNSSTKRFFYYDKERKVWQVSALGRVKLQQLALGGNDNGGKLQDS